MSAQQFEEWIAYFGIEPFGDEWQRTALLASLTANANRNQEEKPDPFTVDDFMPVQRPDSIEEAEDPDAGWKRNKELLNMMMESKQHA